MSDLTTEQIQSIESRVKELEEEVSNARRWSKIWKQAAKGNREDVKYYLGLATKTALLNKDGFTCEE